MCVLSTGEIVEGPQDATQHKLPPHLSEHERHTLLLDPEVVKPTLNILENKIQLQHG